MKAKKVIVIGGGISGLATAYFIRKRAERAGILLQLQIIEKEIQCGGKIKSIKDGGYLYEWGPNGFLDNKPQTLDLCMNLGISEQLLVSNDNARKRFIYSNRKLHKLPHSVGQFLSSNLLSFGGRLRVLVEPFIARYKGSADESLASFTRRRLGQDVLDKLITPMASGIFAGNPETMSLKACFPRIHELEQKCGSLIKAMLKQMRERKRNTSGMDEKVPSSAAGPGGKLTSFYGGMQTLTDKLADYVGFENIIYAEVTKIEADLNGGYRLITSNGDYQADLVVSAIPAYAASVMFSSFNTELQQLLCKIKYASLVVVCSSYDAHVIKHDLNGFGYLLARDETIPVLGTLWESSIFANRAPDGRVFLRTMIGGSRQPGLVALNDDEIRQLVRDAFEQILGIDAIPDEEQIFRHKAAIPEYTLGHNQLVCEIERRLEPYPGLFITGNAFHGVGVNDCVLSAENVAFKVVDYLTLGNDKNVYCVTE